ncbi:hypothetical protein CASFOL_031520 [Castilleja foliolosa]|uniref:DUF7769 domain-containing protein n=1 Tax=Castilleja foliolosa TaxID=1961234 RepID=A0ABD3C5L7_9LAMI
MRSPLIELDLNRELPQIESSNEIRQQEKDRIILPDLNIVSPEFIDEDEIDPSFSTSQILQVGGISPDVNNEPSSQTYNEDHGDTGNQKNIHLSNDKLKAIYNTLLLKSINGKLKRGATKMVAAQFSVHIRTVQRIWSRSEKGKHDDVSGRRSGNCGRKKIHIDTDQIREIPLNQRTTLHSLACSLNTSKSTLHRRLKSGCIRRHSNAIKPFLKEENKISRLKFCLSMLDNDCIQDDPIFKGMYNIIHIDEKWFYLSKKMERYYLLPDEEDPLRTCKSKNFITKVMFLVAIARPRFDEQGNELFSGKIGTFPFVTKQAAKRSSANRVAGTLETKPITSVNRETMRSFLIDKVIPAIKEKWPNEDSRYPIYIQQDNARTHIDINDGEFRRAATQDGFDIRLMCQPPNSPDLNVLDLGFFSAIQSLQYKEAPKNVDELVNAVHHAFDVFPSVKSNHIFLTLQLCMVEIMRANGANKYKIPHINKSMLEREGRLPTQMRCDRELLQEVLNYLS